MKLKNRLSHLIATMLGVLALIFSTTNANARDRNAINRDMNSNPRNTTLIGTISFKAGCTVTVNTLKVESGHKVYAGDAIRTSPGCAAKVRLIEGGSMAIAPGTRVRIYLEGATVVAAVLVGGVNYAPGHTPGGNETPVIDDNAGAGDGAESLPYVAAFGYGSFPIIGGGGSSDAASAALIQLLISNGVPSSIALSTAAAISKVLATGGTITITGSNGRQLTFGTLGSGGNGGTPVSIKGPDGSVVTVVLPGGSI